MNYHHADTLLDKGIVAKEAKQFGEAAKYFTEAIILAESEEYFHGVLHGLLNLGTIWKLTAREMQSVDLAKLARSSFLQAVSYAQDHNLPEEELVQAHFLLGQAEMGCKNYQAAVPLYAGVTEFYRQHPRSTAHLGDVERHWGTALYKTGQQTEGIRKMEEGLRKIRTFDEGETGDKRNFVWETGALLALAEAYVESDPIKAKQAATEARQIAERENVTIRAEEAIKMLKKIP